MVMVVLIGAGDGRVCGGNCGCNGCGGCCICNDGSTMSGGNGCGGGSNGCGGVSNGCGGNGRRGGVIMIVVDSSRIHVSTLL